eukprot:6204669-Pleurochrysis_carterae.AAC.2
MICAYFITTRARVHCTPSSPTPLQPDGTSKTRGPSRTYSVNVEIHRHDRHVTITQSGYVTHKSWRPPSNHLHA